MKLNRPIRSVITYLVGKRISLSSLQFRLTLELVVLSTVGLSTIAVWAGWQMEQNLVAAHKQTLEYIAMRFPEQLEFYSESEGSKTGLEQTINRVSTTGLGAWVKDTDGKLIAYSPNLDSTSAEIRNVTDLAEVPEKPTIVRFDNRDIVLCGTPLTLPLLR